MNTLGHLPRPHRPTTINAHHFTLYSRDGTHSIRSDLKPRTVCRCKPYPTTPPPPPPPPPPLPSRLSCSTVEHMVTRCVPTYTSVTTTTERVYVCVCECVCNVHQSIYICCYCLCLCLCCIFVVYDAMRCDATRRGPPTRHVDVPRRRCSDAVCVATPLVSLSFSFFFLFFFCFYFFCSCSLPLFIVLLVVLVVVHVLLRVNVQRQRHTLQHPMRTVLMSR